MTSNIKVSQIMTTGVVVAHTGSTFSQVMQFFTERHIQHLPVADNDLLIGIISVNDMANFIFNHSRQSGKADAASLDAAFKVADVMTAKPTTVSPDDNAEKVVEILAQGQFQALPVTEDGIIKGIVTNKDLVRMLHWEYTHDGKSNYSRLASHF